MLGIARRCLVGDDAAEDIVQDAMVRLWNMRDSLHEPIGGMANVVVHNLAVDYLRRKKLREEAYSLTEPDNGTAQETAERYNRVMRIADTLAPMQQLVFRLRLIEGKEYSEIASITGLSEPAARKVISRARLAIRNIYLKEENEQ